MFESLAAALSRGLLSPEQSRGINTLIPKKDSNRRDLSNWHPITLLNTDYKVLTKALALRLQSCVKEVISDDQTGFLSGRYIGMNVRCIQDALQYAQDCQEEGFVFACDFRKAFDTVNWELIRWALVWFGFGEVFTDMIGTLYNEVETAILNKGYSSRYFKPSRGVRKGCCISPYLFILVAEVLAIQLREDPDIHGLLVQGRELKVSLFADDLTGFARDLPSLVKMIKRIEAFGDQSGKSRASPRFFQLCRTRPNPDS